MAPGILRYHALALTVVAVWGVTFVCTKVLIASGMDPAAIFFCRFTLAYAGIWAYTLVTRQQKRIWNGWRDEAVFALLGISGGSFYFLTENTALAYTQAANVAFVVSSAPLFTAIFTILLSRFGKGRLSEGLEKVRIAWPLVGGTLLAITGMALVVFEGNRLQLSAKGDLLAVAAALCWAVYSVFMGQTTRRYGVLTATRKVFFYGLLTILPFLGRCMDSFSPEVLAQTQVWTNLLFLGLVASLACFLAWNVALDKLGNITSTNYVYLNPVFTLISATILLGERMTPLAAVGSAAIMAGVIWAGKR